jgi:hypothetical protein
MTEAPAYVFQLTPDDMRKFAQQVVAEQQNPTVPVKVGHGYTYLSIRDCVWVAVELARTGKVEDNRDLLEKIGAALAPAA